MSSQPTYSKNILMPLFAGLVLFGLGLLFVWPINIPWPKIFVDQFVTQPVNYSIAISNLQNPSDFYKVSPFDDVIIFSDGTRQKVLPADNSLTNEYLKNSSGLLKRIELVWQEILRKPQVKFIQQENFNDLQIVYQVTKNQNVDAILVNKQIRNLPQKATGFIDAFGFTKDDFVIDSKGTLYTRPDEIGTLQKIIELAQTNSNFSKKLQVQKFNQDRVKIQGISFLQIINPRAAGKIVIRVQSEQKVTLDLNYRLIEIETHLEPAQTEVEHQQIIYFGR